MREEYVRSNSVAGEPSTAYHPSPVSFCVDIPFSSVRSSKLQQQQQEQQQTVETGAEVGKEFSQQSRSVNSMHDPQPQGSCVVPLPSFLSLETAAARDRRLQQQLQQQPLLSTPAWGEPVTADITALDIERAADAAAQRAEAQRNRSMLAAAVVSARAASAVGVAEAVAAAAEARAAASADAPTTRKAPFSSAATRLRSALSRFPHAGNKEQEPQQAAATGAAAAAAAADGSPTSYEVDSPSAAAAGAAAPGEAVEEAAPAARAAYRSEAQHSASRPEEESRGPQRAPSSLACSFPIESSGLKEIATATERDENEASAVEMSSLVSVLPFESCWRLSGCLKICLVVEPLPGERHPSAGPKSAGKEWMGIQRAKVESRLQQPTDGVYVHRKLPSLEEALLQPQCSSSVGLHFQGPQGEGGPQEEGVGAPPALAVLAHVALASVQLADTMSGASGNIC
ncbi:uncharacterized protein EMH_0078710 [Eimeria mitis]|uniref:Uncharacterized protein n=1 Tax=Eimeria mitis TaxID=44415 RepID=U6K5A3_9EIME|nr:uncharacterized protein EMH_0078710 [Eimeria mitis]CDJ32925.1 hypothetical protein EMH_0078710 [Eimeria mitis]